MSYYEDELGIVSDLDTRKYKSPSTPQLFNYEDETCSMQLSTPI